MSVCRDMYDVTELPSKKMSGQIKLLEQWSLEKKLPNEIFLTTSHDVNTQRGMKCQP